MECAIFALIDDLRRMGNQMPIYVYERPDGSRFELRQGFNDESLTNDPETGVSVRRVMQPAPVIFKGSGWYKTDSRATSSTTAEAAKTDATAATAEKSDGKSEGKTEATSTKEAVSTATESTKAEIKSKAEKSAIPAAAS